MKQYIKIAVLGGGGRTGKFLVTQLLEQGYRLRLLLRTPENFTIESPFIDIVQGDAVDPDAIHELLEGCHAVISTVGQRKDEPMVSSQATINVLKSMSEHGISRYILLAGLNVDTPCDKKGPRTEMATAWMKANYPEPHADRQEMYSILSASDLDWTLVRVPLIGFSEDSTEVIVDLEDCKGETIHAADIAAFLIAQLSEEEYFKKSPFITNP